MSEPLPAKRASPWWTALLFAIGYGLLFGLTGIEHALSNVVRALFWEKGTNLFYALNVQQFILVLHQALAVVLAVASPIAFVALFGRPLWERRRLRGPGPGKLTAFVEAHPGFVGRVLPWAAGLGWFVLANFMKPVVLALFFWGRAIRAAEWTEEIGRTLNNLGYVTGSVVGIIGIAAAVRYGVQALTRGTTRAPTSARSEGDEDKEGLAAVAVTASTKGAVMGLAGLSLLVAYIAATAHSNQVLAPVVLAYVLAALGTATLFRRISRIAVGIDGVLIRGADRTRFFGYADLDVVEARGSDVLLKRRGRTALRLQLHDTDVTRAPELADRIQRAMEKAARMRVEGADLLMQATKAGSGASGRLASSARGGLDYRQPAMAREQLWQLIEGPVSNAEARTVAAQALADDLSDDDRARLRVAADRCAEPRARVALVQVLEDDEEEESEASAGRIKVAGRQPQAG